MTLLDEYRRWQNEYKATWGDKWIESGHIFTKEKGGPRTARFCCVIALSFPDGTEATAEGVCEGEIAAAPAGSNGFGYDPVFYIPQMGRTMAELTAAQKNAVSHRGAAVRKMILVLRKKYGDN